jgi:branched-chain amino acid transport system permease protein
MSTFVLLTLTGLGLGAMYFLIASGLSLIYGLMGVLNFAHGAFITVGAYGTWWTSVHVFDGIHSTLWRWLASSLLGLLCGGVFVALITGIWGPDAKTFVVPPWLHETTTIGGAHIPNDRWVEIATAAVVLALLQLFLRKTRYGLIIRAGVENRAMVQALGIDVRKAFTLVFAIGGIAAAVAGVLSGVYFNVVGPDQGTSLLIFAFIVVVIGGLGSITGSAIAAVVVALVQQYTNYYSSGMGDIIVVLMLGIVLLIRPRGIAGAIVGARA